MISDVWIEWDANSWDPDSWGEGDPPPPGPSLTVIARLKKRKGATTAQLVALLTSVGLLLTLLH